MEREDDPNEETVMLTRRMRRAQPAASNPVAEASAEDEVDESTVIVEERTVVIDRGQKAAAPHEDGVAEDLYDTRVSYDTVRVQSPPAAVVEETPAIYKPRAAPRVPSSPPPLAGDIEPTRVTDAVTGSVVKASRRRSLFSVAAVAAAGVVSVVGLALLGVAVFGG
jgi:hypothetical protein